MLHRIPPRCIQPATHSESYALLSGVAERSLLALQNVAVTPDLCAPELLAAARFRLSFLAGARHAAVTRLTWDGGVTTVDLAGAEVSLQEVGSVSLEPPRARRLPSSVGEHDGEVWNHDGADPGNGG